MSINNMRCNPYFYKLFQQSFFLPLPSLPPRIMYACARKLTRWRSRANAQEASSRPAGRTSIMAASVVRNNSGREECFVYGVNSIVLFLILFFVFLNYFFSRTMQTRQTPCCFYTPRREYILLNRAGPCIHIEHFGGYFDVQGQQ